jgi:hypothetical protein
VEVGFCPDWNGLKWVTLVLARLEWFGMCDPGFGMTGMFWNRGIEVQQTQQDENDNFAQKQLNVSLRYIWSHLIIIFVNLITIIFWEYDIFFFNTPSFFVRQIFICGDC